jgi:hypothetical protein
MIVLNQMQSGSIASAPARLTPSRANPSGRMVRNSREYMLIYVFTFPLFFLAACIGRLSPAPAPRTGRRSIYGEAKVLASATIPMAFMG